MKPYSRASKERGTVGRVLLLCTALATIHSFLALRSTKDLVQRIVGARYRNGLYRFTYNVVSVVLLGWASWWFLRLPDREVYRVRPP
jgi:hypothetical protein